MAEQGKPQGKPQKSQGKPQGKNDKSEYQMKYDNYSIFLHDRSVELHIAYGNSVMKLQGVAKFKGKFDVQLYLDDKNYLVINKSFIIMIKPL